MNYRGGAYLSANLDKNRGRIRQQNARLRRLIKEQDSFLGLRALKSQRETLG